MGLDDHLEIVTPEGVLVRLDIVGIGARFLARLLDTLIQVGLMFALLLAIGVTGVDSGFVDAIAIVLGSLILFAYDIVCELTMRGQTPGKRAAGIRVVDREGRMIGFTASALRNVLRLVDFLPFLYGAGLVTMVATKHAQRLGDLAAGTLVIRERATQETVLRLRSSHARPTVPLAEVAHWDVTLVTADEILAIRHFLDRRVSLPPLARRELAQALAAPLTAKVVGIPSARHPEYVLEGIVVAKEQR